MQRSPRRSHASDATCGPPPGVDAVELAELAADAARRAGALLLERFEEPAAGLDTKSSATDMVTDADRASEALIIATIRSARPDDTVLGEESGWHPGSAGGLLWLIDPLDGTTNFVYGHKAWAVSIAGQIGSTGVAGAVYAPCDEELFVAAAGFGTTCNGRPVHVSDRNDLSTALIATGFAYTGEARAAQGRHVANVLARVRDIRRGGSAALDLAWLAAGRFDGFYESPLAPWDTAAGSILVTEAGGVVRPLPDPEGRPSGGGVVAAGPALIDALERLARPE